MCFFSVLNQVYQGQLCGYKIEKQSKTSSRYKGQTVRQNLLMQAKFNI